MTARTLARSGYDVKVVEEHAAVGFPVHCTGVLGLEAFHELELPRDPICGIVSSARFWGGRDQSVLVESDQVRAAVVDRERFDDQLAGQAIAAGATVTTDARVNALMVGPDGVTAQVGRHGRAVEARACVLACGANYRFNRQLGLGVPRVFVQSAQVERVHASQDHVEVYLENTIAKGGFAWLVPFTRDGASYAKIGLVCDEHPEMAFQRLVERLAPTSGVPDPWPVPRLKMLPLAPPRRTFASRVLAVGDAAGMVKPTTGGGIYYGLLSGHWAAETLDGALRAGSLEARALKSYESRWRQRLGPELRAGLAFRKLATRLDDRAIGALVELARVDGIIPLLKQTADFNWHRDAAMALMRNASFRRVVLSSLWG